MTTPASTRKPIVVGTAGSESATRAVRWAAREALLRHRSLKIVNVYAWPLSGYPDGLVVSADLHDALQAESTKTAEAAKEVAEEVMSSMPELTVSTTATAGIVHQVLHKMSEDAELVVLGSRGLGGFTGPPVGSAAVGLSSRAGCPVTVVRGTSEPAGGSGVVGVDGTPVSEGAIGVALAEAAAR